MSLNKSFKDWALNQLNIVRICGLLHDIGKLDCWADRKPLSEHVLYTYKFVKECLGEELAVHAMRHHVEGSYGEEYHPKSLVEEIICLADNLASGADQPEVLEGCPYTPSWRVELTHVLNPNVVRRSIDSTKLAYVSQTLLKNLRKLEEAFHENSTTTYRRIFETLRDSELRFIPADVRSPINDVSLWNHLKLTAAFATCIYHSGYRGSSPNHYTFALLSGDVDRILSFINESLRLPDLNARSKRIEEATEAAGEAISLLLGPECLLYAGGGSFLAISPPEMAEKVLDEAKRAFEDKMGHRVTLTVSYVVENGERFRETYGEVWRRAQENMRLKKSQRILIPKIEIDESKDVCDICGKAVAAKADELRLLPIDASLRPERLCEFCYNLREEGKGVWLDDLVQKTNFVACVRMDGDNVGRFLSGETFKRQNKASTPSRISTLSDLLNDVCKEFNGLVSSFDGKLIFAGGDDVLAFLPGERGLEAAYAVASRFRETMAGKCTMSAGVAIFHYKLPVYVGLESAGYLLSKAKDDGRDRIAFAVIGGSDVTLSELTKVKSWKWSELETIMEITKFMQRSDVVSSQLRKIAGILANDLKRNLGTYRTEAFVKYQMGRGAIDWAFGEKILSYIKTGFLFEAFFIYNLFKGD
jgi:CRISPR/Cas system-associated protein Cas10 (large subunit of type III CRISPR-Cas system)